MPLLGGQHFGLSESTNAPARGGTATLASTTVIIKLAV